VPSRKARWPHLRQQSHPHMHPQQSQSQRHLLRQKLWRLLQRMLQKNMSLPQLLHLPQYQLQLS
jgi:hypothetical protein